MPSELVNILSQHRIRARRVISPIVRKREKEGGAMWFGELDLDLTNAITIRLVLWKHFTNDIGGNWYPTEQQLRDSWMVSSAKPTTYDGLHFRDEFWELCRLDENIYLCLTSSTTNPDALHAQIRAGCWQTDDHPTIMGLYIQN